jgi:hypothetical protein
MTIIETLSMTTLKETGMGVFLAIVAITISKIHTD